MLVPSLRGLSKRSADIGPVPPAGWGLESGPAITDRARNTAGIVPPAAATQPGHGPESLLSAGLGGFMGGLSQGASNIASAPGRAFTGLGNFLTSRRPRVNQRDAGPTTELDIQKGSLLDSLGIGGREERRGMLLDDKIRQVRQRIAKKNK